MKQQSLSLSYSGPYFLDTDHPCFGDGSGVQSWRTVKQARCRYLYILYLAVFLSAILARLVCLTKSTIRCTIKTVAMSDQESIQSMSSVDMKTTNLKAECKWTKLILANGSFTCTKIYKETEFTYIQCVCLFRVLSSSGSRDFDVQTTHQR